MAQYPKFSEGGYITTDNTYTITGISYTSDGITGGIIPGSAGTSPINNKLYVMMCIVFGLDTPELRTSFRKFYNAIDSSWGTEKIYEFLIEKAYEVKYGERPD